MKRVNGVETFSGPQGVWQDSPTQEAMDREVPPPIGNCDNR